MAKSRPESKQFAALRKRAEEFVNKNLSALKKMPPRDIQNLIEDLNIHQVELQMQNEELRRTQLKLEKARDNYTNLYDFAPAGYFTITPEGIIVKANLTGAVMIGLEREVLIGKPFTDFINKNDQDVFYLHRKKLFKTKAKQTCELRLVKKDGVQFYAQLESSVVQGSDNNSDQHRIIISDITARVQAAEALQKAHNELKNRIDKRTAELNKIKAINTLAGGIAHQFNNALSGITGNIDLIEMDFPNNANMAGYIQQMKDSSDRMITLTNQLLAYSRGGKYQAETVSLKTFVESVLPLIHYGIDHSIEIETDLLPDALNITADPVQMQMVFSAILTNASEAIEGEGHIRISTRTEEIDDEFVKYHTALKPGYYACLEIEDNGKGMDNTTKRNLFEPFFTTKSPGRGLGMAAAYGFVKNHNGWISVYSEAGRGTVVRIYLPAVDAPATIPVTSKRELPHGSGTILIVEDEEMVMDVSRALLERSGYRVLPAVNGQEAVSIAKSYDGKIDLALLDIILPDIEGKEVYPQLMEARPNLKVIVCSGYSVDGPAREILDKGAQGFIQKPFSLTALLEILNEVLKD